MAIALPHPVHEKFQNSLALSLGIHRGLDRGADGFLQNAMTLDHCPA
jgi:hypothetical protein